MISASGWFGAWISACIMNTLESAVMMIVGFRRLPTTRSENTPPSRFPSTPPMKGARGDEADVHDA